MKRRLDGGVQLFALVISLVIAMFLGVMIYYSYLNKALTIQLNNTSQLYHGMNSGIQYLLSNPESTTRFSLSDQDTIEVGHSNWGIYKLGKVVSHRKGKTLSRSFLLGNTFSKETAHFILVDQNKGLALCGSTVLKGNVAIPKAGIKRAYIEGKSYYGKELIYGLKMNSPSQLPTLKPIVLNKVAGGESEMMEDLPARLNNSFSQETKILFAESLEITSKIRGNVVINVDGVCYISKRAQLNEVLIYADSIVVESGFEGSVQLFATRGINVERDVQLKYPSSLVLTGNGAILLEENCSVEGTILITEKGSGNKKNKLQIEKRALVRGACYNNGVTMLKGNVEGYLWTSSFILKTPSSIYENHLLDATVDGTRLPNAFVVGDLFADQSNQIAKWLY